RAHARQVAEQRGRRRDIRVGGRGRGLRVDLERALARLSGLLVAAGVPENDLLAGVEGPQLRIARAQANRGIELAEPFLGPARDPEELAEERARDGQA